MKVVNAKREEVLISAEAAMWATPFMLPLNLIKMFCLHIRLVASMQQKILAIWIAWVQRKSKVVDFILVKTP